MSLPNSETLELQRTLLEVLQTEISAELFDTGAALAIATARGESLVPKRVSLGASFWETPCVPIMRAVDMGGTDMMLLGMARLRPGDEDDEAKVLRVHMVGPIDDSGRLYPVPHVPPMPAKILYNAAVELVRTRDEGELPNLSADLLRIEDNPTLL